MLSILLSFLSGAVGGALVTALINYFFEKHTRKVSYIRNQIDNFYGPLYFIIMHSENLLELSKKIVDAGQQVYTDVPANGKTEARQQRDEEEISDIFSLSNEYGDEAVENNEKMFKIISSNYSYIDLDDIEVINSFIENYSRLKIEYLGKRKLSLQVCNIVGKVSVLQSVFKDKIKQKFNLKKSQLS